MRRFLLLLPAALLASCVTINVYFPAAEAQKAAEAFIEEVIDPSDAASTPPLGEEGEGASAEAPRPSPPARVLVAREWRFDPVGFFIGTAHAQDGLDIRIRTPAVQAIQQRMAERFQSTLAPLFDAGALGFGSDGLLVLRDPAKVPLSQRTAAAQAVADDNRDRRAVYREIAVANGHPEWEQAIRDTFAKEWIAQARPGWWYQDGAGAWKQK
ncbi:MAG: YdbL family protein [Lysobacteraceae bacterium]